MELSQHHYLPHTPADVEAMLRRCGVEKIDDLYSDVDPALRLKHPYLVPEALSDPELTRYFSGLDSLNQPLDCCAGAGYYDHHTPAVIPALLSRSEFYTAYTPYQPEISQGTLQYIFEFQSIMTMLTDMDVSNASMYDGATATAEAMMMAVHAARKKQRVLISEAVSEAVRRVVATYARYHDITLDVIPEQEGVSSLDAAKAMLAEGNVAGVIVSAPNCHGIIEDFTGWADACHGAKALLIMNCPAITLAAIRTPGEWGADIACGDAQSMGMPLNFGGPYLGYMCCRKELMRKLPGRIVGATTDARGQRAFVLTLQAREQHIRREKATSNICSNQGLMALHTAIYASLLGADGLRQVNLIGAQVAHHFASRIAEVKGVELCYPKAPFLNELELRFTAPVDLDAIIEQFAEIGILAGVKTAADRMLVAFTEKSTLQLVDEYVEQLKESLK
jgi:glycine dehydrogenase subunit 1